MSVPVHSQTQLSEELIKITNQEERQDAVNDSDYDKLKHMVVFNKQFIESHEGVQSLSVPQQKCQNTSSTYKTDQLEQIMSVGALSSEESIGQVSITKIKEEPVKEQVQSLKSLLISTYNQINSNSSHFNSYQQKHTPNTTTPSTPEKTVENTKQIDFYNDGRRRTKSSINPSEYLKQCGKKDIKLSILLNSQGIDDLDKTQMFKKVLKKHRLNQLGSPTQSNISIISNSAMRSSFFTPGQSVSKKKETPFIINLSEMNASQVNSKLRQSFSTSSRQVNVSQVKQTPSPADYDIQKCDKLVRPNSPGQVFSKSPRYAWVDSKIKKEGQDSTPGPDYNNLRKSNLSSPATLSVKKIPSLTQVGIK